MNSRINDSRIKMLEQKLNLNDNYSTSASYSNYDLINTKLKEVGDHLSEIINQTNSKFRLIKDNIKAISNMFEDNKLKDEHMLENKMNYIKVLEKKINERFEEEANKREEIENRIFTMINNKFNSLLYDVNNEIQNRVSCTDNLKLYLESHQNDNPDLKQALVDEKKKRTDNDNEINSHIIEEMNNMQSIINEQKKIREESEQEMLDTLKNMIDKTKNELNKEKRKRKSAEENILSLIEDTVMKINQLEEMDSDDKY